MVRPKVKPIRIFRANALLYRTILTITFPLRVLPILNQEMKHIVSGGLIREWTPVI